MAKFEAPIIKEWDFMTVWIFEKNKKICMDFPKIQMVV